MITITKGLQSASFEMDGSTTVADIVSRAASVFLIDEGSCQVARAGQGAIPMDALIADGETFTLLDKANVKG